MKNLPSFVKNLTSMDFPLTSNYELLRLVDETFSQILSLHIISEFSRILSTKYHFSSKQKHS